jgi:uncharacterized protein YceK
MASNRKWTVACSGMLLLIAILVSGCSSASSSSSNSQSADPLGADYQTKMDEALKQASECQTQGGSAKDCAAPVGTIMKNAADNLKTEAAAKAKKP